VNERFRGTVGAGNVSANETFAMDLDPGEGRDR
jgi:hypothetical protein